MGRRNRHGRGFAGGQELGRRDVGFRSMHDGRMGGYGGLADRLGAHAGGPPATSFQPKPAVRSAAIAIPAEPLVDREKTCPFLLRMFPKLGTHHMLEDFGRRGEEPKDQIQVYTWLDATLREICDLVKEVHPVARRPTARLSFALVYPDRRGRNVLRHVGTVHSTRLGEDDDKTLKSVNFQIGDFIDIAIY